VINAISAQTVKSTDLSSIRGELRVLKISVFLMILFASLNLVALLRLLGTPGLPPLLLLLYRLMDAIIVISFLMYCRQRVKVQGTDLLMIIFATYPFLIGIAKGNLSITFANDTVIYYLFIAKIVIFRTILLRIQAVTDLDVVFKKLAARLIFWCALFGLVSLSLALLLLGTSSGRYYQAPAEITFAAALALAQGNAITYLVFLMIALAAGKRMVMIGLITIGLFGIFTHARTRRAAARTLFVTAVLSFIAVASSLLNSDLVFLDKIMGTARLVERAVEQSDSLLEIIMYTDPLRFAEYVSLAPYLTDWSLWLGNGYGFRYGLDYDFAREFGLVTNTDVTNAHFTPLAIVAKFGSVGLIIWVVFVLRLLVSPAVGRSVLATACWLAFISIIVQSMFAFSFFINIFTPFYVAVLNVFGRSASVPRYKATSVTAT
jgi:hypothetical protein